MGLLTLASSVSAVDGAVRKLTKIQPTTLMAWAPSLMMTPFEAKGPAPPRIEHPKSPEELLSPLMSTVARVGSGLVVWNTQPLNWVLSYSPRAAFLLPRVDAPRVHGDFHASNADVGWATLAI